MSDLKNKKVVEKVKGVHVLENGEGGQGKSRSERMIECTGVAR